jgi:hypothetical protein
MASTFIHPVRFGLAGAPTVFNVPDRGRFFERASPRDAMPQSLGACASIIDNDELLIAHGCTSASEPHLLATVHATDDAELLAYIEHRRRWAY